MKQLLLFGFSCTMGYSIVNAQNLSYFPSGITVAPTWEYYRITNNPNGGFTNVDNGISGDVLMDASLHSPSIIHSDAYDGAFEFYVNDIMHPYALTNEQYEQVDTTNGTFTFPAISLENHLVSKHYYFYNDKPLVRTIIKIQNPNADASNVEVGIRSNLGSDSNTELDTCYTGNSALTDADRWMITWDSLDFGDPVLTWVRYGGGQIQCTPSFTFKPENGSDVYEDKFQFSVPGNDYRLIVLFAGLDSTRESARIHVLPFNSMNFLQTAGYFSGLNNNDKLRVINWDFNLPAGVEEQTEQPNATLSPNPGTGTFHLTAETTIQNLIVTNTSGAEILRIAPDSVQSEFQLEKQPAGLYYVRVIMEKGETTLKLVLN